MIARNAGAEGSMVVEKVRSSKDDQFGYNALTDTYENIVTAGVAKAAPFYVTWVR